MSLPGIALSPPYIDRELVEHEPITYGKWPLEESSTLAKMAKRAYLRMQHPSRMDKATDIAVATKIFAKMQDVVAQRGSKVLIAVMDPWPAEDGPQWAEWLPLIRPFQEGTSAVRQFLVDSAAKGRADFLECFAGNSLDTPQFKPPDGQMT
jgi:hypothetical protein